MIRTRSAILIKGFILLSAGVGFAQSPTADSSEPINLTASAVSAPAGTPMTFHATLAADKRSSTTQRSEIAKTRMTFFDRATILGTAPMNGQGEASFSTAWLAAGRHSVYAVAPGGARSQATVITIERVLSNRFGAAKHFPAGLTPSVIAISDFDGDGHLDIALAGATGISVLLGRGDGDFKAPRPTATAFQPTAIAAGDFDGDGVMDLTVTDCTTGKIYILRGAGDGTFSTPRVVATGINPVALAIGDFNGDGVADLAVADQAGNTVLLLLGNGDGTFAEPARIQAGAAPAALAVGDFNSDGAADLAVANFGGNDVTILLGKGDGTFSSGASLKVGNGPAAIIMSDLNGDGIEDLAVLNRLDATAAVFYGKGDGTFQAGLSLSAGKTPVGIAASDPDKGGFRALLVADGSKIRWQQLTAASSRPVVQIDAGAVANGIAVADFTGAGRTGVVIGDQNGVVWHPRSAGSTAYLIPSHYTNPVTSGQSFNFQVDAATSSYILDSSYTDHVHFSLQNPDPRATLPADSFLTNGTGQFSATLVAPGNNTLLVSDPDNPGPTGSAPLYVQGPSATHFSVAASSPVTAGSASTVTVTALDASNATVTSYSGTVQLTSSDGQAVLPGDSTLTSGVGIFSVTPKTAGNQTVTATDTVTSSITGTSNAITVNAGAATTLSVSAPLSVAAGNSFNVQVTAQDQFRNTATGYAGTVSITSSDPHAVLPANSTLSGGTGLFRVTLETAGWQTITATDTSNPTLSTTTKGTNVHAGFPAIVRAGTGTPQSAVAGTAFSTPLQVTVLDNYNNVVSGAFVMYKVPPSGASAVMSRKSAETDESGVASIMATANLVPGTYAVMAEAEGKITSGSSASPRYRIPSATFTLTNLPNVTVQTSPPGLAFSVDGTSYTGSESFGFDLNSSHVIAVASLQTGASGVQYTFSNWSDNGAGSHPITATGTAVTYTATFVTQYQLTTSASPAAGGTVMPASGDFYNAGATIPLVATKNLGYRFDHWSGVTTESKNAIASIVMNGPETATAVFVQVSAQVSPGVLNLQYNQGADPSTAAGKLSVTTVDNSAFSVSPADAWLTVSSSSITTPATVTVTPNVSGMKPGTYNSSVTFNFSDGSVRVIPVTLTVLGVPQLLWSQTSSGSLDFTVQAGSTAVQSRDIIVSSSIRDVPVQVAASITSPAAGHWLSVSSYGNVGTTPQALHVHVDPSGLASGVYQGTITATSAAAGISPLTIPVTLTLTTLPPAISVSAIENSASSSKGEDAPNTILSAFGVFPGCTSGAQVSVDGKPTDVFYSSATQVNFLLPASVSGEQTASVQIQCGGLKSPVLKVPVLHLAPAIFTVNEDGSGQAAIVNQDGSVGTPTKAGSYIQIYGTGFGMLKPAGPDGLCWLELPVTATVGGIPAKVMYAGEAPGSDGGLQQINVLIPADAPHGTAVALQLTVGGVTTRAGVTLTIQ